MHKQHLVWKSSTKNSEEHYFKHGKTFSVCCSQLNCWERLCEEKRDKDSPEYLPKLYANNQHKFKTNKKQYSQLFPPLFTLLKSGVASEQDKHRQCLSVLCKCKLRMWKFRPEKLNILYFWRVYGNNTYTARIAKGFTPKKGERSWE